MLEFLAEYEVEVAATTIAIHFVETVGPVDTHHTNHRQEYTQTGTC